MTDEIVLETEEIPKIIDEQTSGQGSNGDSHQFNGSYLNLSDGFEIQSLKEDKVYTIRNKFAKGGEGQSYIATDKEGNIKVLKIKELGESKQFTDFEEKVSAEFCQINGKLGTNYHVFTINDQYLATVADYIEGKNIKEELKSRNAVFSEHEVIDVLLQLAEKYLQPLHEADIVHRGIKPENIIASADQDGSKDFITKKYFLIDFGSIRQYDQLATVTGHFVGSLGYSKIKGRYEKSDDFYSLARTAYFLFTAKDPEFVAIDEYDKMADERRFKALKIDDGLRSILLKMTGHEKDKDKRYSSADEIIADLKNIEQELRQNNKNEQYAEKSPIITMDVESAQKLTRYREASEPPIALLQKIKGLKTLFREQYANCKADRHPLSTEFLFDLDEVMNGLGYHKKKLIEIRIVNIAPITYIRMRKDSNMIDVLHLKSTAKSKNIDDYFDYFTVEDQTLVEKLCMMPYYNEAKQKELLKQKESIDECFGYGIALAFIFGAASTLLTFIFTAPSPENQDNFLTVLKYSLPISSVLGGFLGFFGFQKSESLNKINQYNYMECLEEALKPAPKFTYENGKIN